MGLTACGLWLVRLTTLCHPHPVPTEQSHASDPFHPLLLTLHSSPICLRNPSSFFFFWLFSYEVLSNSFTTPWTIAHQAPLSTGFPRQEYWSESPFLSPGYLPDLGIKPEFLALTGGLFTTEPSRKPSWGSQACI